MPKQVQELVPLEERTDADLLTLARSGDAVASDVLWVRTWPSALSAARFVADTPADAEDLASEAMTAVFSAISRGAGPTDVVRAYVGTTVRNLHTSQLRYQARAGRPVAFDDADVLQLTTTEPDVVESALVSQAFRGLPERWRHVLWATLVEGRSGDEVAATLAIKPAALYALKARALEGLRQQYLTAHALEGRDEECAAVHRSLASTVRGRNRRAAEAQRVWSHLRDCQHCAEGYREMSALNTELGALAGPAVGALALVGAEQGRTGFVEVLRLAGTGAKYGMAAAAVAGVVAATAVTLESRHVAPEPPAAARTVVPAARAAAPLPTTTPGTDVARPVVRRSPVVVAKAGTRKTAPSSCSASPLLPRTVRSVAPGVGVPTEEALPATACALPAADDVAAPVTGVKARVHHLLRKVTPLAPDLGATTSPVPRVTTPAAPVHRALGTVLP